MCEHKKYQIFYWKIYVLVRSARNEIWYSTLTIDNVPIEPENLTNERGVVDMFLKIVRLTDSKFLCREEISSWFCSFSSVGVTEIIVFKRVIVLNIFLLKTIFFKLTYAVYMHTNKYGNLKCFIKRKSMTTIMYNIIFNLRQEK